MRLPVLRSISCKKADGQPPSLLQKPIMKPQWLKDAPHTLWHLGYPAHGYSRSPKKLCTQKSRQQERQFKKLARRGYDFLNMPPERLNIAWQQDSDEDVRPGANCDGPRPSPSVDREKTFARAPLPPPQSRGEPVVSLLPADTGLTPMTFTSNANSAQYDDKSSSDMARTAGRQV